MFVTVLLFFPFEPFGCKYRKALLLHYRVLDGCQNFLDHLLALLPGTQVSGRPGSIGAHAEHC